MPEIKFRVNLRFANFWSSIQSTEFKTKETVIYFFGWIITFIIILFPIELIYGLHNLFYVIHGFFWFKFADHVNKKVRPPNELLVASFFLFYLLEVVSLRSIYTTSSFFSSVIQTPGSVFKFFQILLLAILILMFSLILVQNSKGKVRVLIAYVLLGIIGINLIKIEGFFYLIILQIILFIFLLHKTTRLEELTKIECWIYLIIVFFIFRGVSNFNPFQGVQASQLDQMLIWYTLPQFLYLLFKMYLLAVLVKIPVVLVYNFARLSRKLKISSLFQSTFPQIIQLCMLLLIFYFFIAGWQANKVRQSMIDQLQQRSTGNATDSLYAFKFAYDNFDGILQLNGYQPVLVSGHMPDQGILAVTKSHNARTNSDEVDYFLFLISSETREDSIYLVKLDSNFLQVVSKSTSIFAGSQLLAYPYKPSNWESYLYKLTWERDLNFRIFPFGLTSQRGSYTLSVPFKLEEKSSSDWIEEINVSIMKQNQFIVGRVLAPLINANMEQTGFFVFDILLVPDISFVTSSMLRYSLLLVFIYFLVNLLVIRRMTKFGSEINQVIVQKFHQLKNGIREISKGNLDYKVKLEGEDEFVELAERFNQMGDKLKASIAEAREKERLEHELTIARQVQLSLLPSKLPEVPGYQIAATLKTANEVGGDLYDVSPLDKNRYLFAIGDVSGKGTSAAFYMAQCISLIRYSPKFTDEPREIVLRLNEYFADPMIDPQIFVTAIVGMLDVTSSSMRVVRAGHTQPILIPGNNKKSIHELQLHGLAIGLQRSGNLFDEQLQAVDIPIQSGDMIVFYTDGVIEAVRFNSVSHDEKAEKMQVYGEERFINLLTELRGKTAVETLQELTDDLESFYEGSSPVDDYTLLIIQKTSK